MFHAVIILLFSTVSHFPCQAFQRFLPLTLLTVATFAFDIQQLPLHLCISLCWSPALLQNAQHSCSLFLGILQDILFLKSNLFVTSIISSLSFKQTTHSFNRWQNEPSHRFLWVFYLSLLTIIEMNKMSDSESVRYGLKNTKLDLNPSFAFQ